MKFAGDVCCRNGRVYVAEGQDGLGVYRIDRKGGLTEIARLGSMPDYPAFALVLWVNAISDRYVVINDRSVGNIVLDVSDFPVMKPVHRHHLGTTWWDKYIAGQAVGGYLASPVTGKSMSWMDMRSSEIKNINDKSVVPTGAACVYKDGTVLVHVKQQGLCQLEPGVVPAKILASRSGAGFNGSPVWDGKETLAINFRHGRTVRKVYLPSVEDAKVIWSEKLEGYPDRVVFWDGKMVVPGGYQGILVEK
jgi:hypothetical protein